MRARIRKEEDGVSLRWRSGETVGCWHWVVRLAAVVDDGAGELVEDEGELALRVVGDEVAVG